MEESIQDPLRDLCDELRAEAISWHRQASSTQVSQDMFCRGVQDNGLQHKEVGQGLYGPEKAIARLPIVYLRLFGSLRPD